MATDKEIERRSWAMICRDCGLWQYDNLLHTCSKCGGQLIHRFDKNGKPVELEPTKL